MCMHSQRETVTCLALSSELNSAHNLQVPWIRQRTTILQVYTQSKRWCTRVKDPAGHVRVQTHQKNPACTKSVSLQSEAGYYTEEQCKLTIHRSNHIQVLGQYTKAQCIIYTHEYRMTPLQTVLSCILTVCHRTIFSNRSKHSDTTIITNKKGKKSAPFKFLLQLHTHCF